MKIAKNMNLVIPVETENGNAYVHSRPLSKEAWRENSIVLAKAYSAIFTEGIGIMSGPRVAHAILKQVAGNEWEGASGVRNTLVNEIIRNTSVMIPSEGKGWDEIPLDVAIDRDLVDEDEVLGELVFFTCVSVISKKTQGMATLEMASGLWGSVITSLNATEWVASLPTSDSNENSGETEIIS